MTFKCRALAGILLASLPFVAAQAESSPWTLEKVVEVSRHGVRPPTEGNAKAIQEGTGRKWPTWLTPFGELTGHGYAAAVLKGQYEGNYLRQHGLLKPGCPSPGEVFVWSSPLQRTQETAHALMDGVFPGCGVMIHATASEKQDTLFHAEKAGLSVDPAKVRADLMKAMDGKTAEQIQSALKPEIDRLQQALCLPDKPCPAFTTPWKLHENKKGNIALRGPDVLANMAETIRLAYSNNMPLSQVAFGNVHNAADVGALMPLLTTNYDFTNDLPYVARRGGSTLMNQIALALEPGKQTGEPPQAAWLLYVAHDTNIAKLRTMLGFTWKMANYPRGNIPPAGSLIFERWRNNQSGQRFLRIYFQAQSLDQIRSLTPLDNTHPPLRTEFQMPGCHLTDVGTLCPYLSTIKRINASIDPTALLAVHYTM
ncbi:histidine-type phosphatase [Pectobacteriaceae bacterium CE70]|uniref:Histidine-type phosphatase n=1 Tax=Serratia sp. (strain ATCC 39006) TaxID=104623 RepID=A0A2I5T2B8_SERS3|nr:histidine-type phosphatase [Serratia sp. ATCC 39006]WJV62625.1 histidine-type phosphatase [Pectobacteriaceae bacterium C52]WJV66950.1 histidine-type phosphatase [Pectobacteriaceae bacterium CE70]WJY10938.1 histidine-type phosphatase [Pectobacteriaceae bacterium C80]AUG98717.1 histidine-type phosphatase [Serratia sp. ATCC 39006]AUH03032.1 histidine-type phosphatase [Serratia sp. ATCC 39006]